MTLPVNRLVNVSVNLAPTAAAVRSIGTLLILGDSKVINAVERYRSYSSASSVATDFGSTAPETLAAQLYFGQSPQPTSLMVGRWLSGASSGHIRGGILSAAQQSLSNFLPITSGGMRVVIDGTPVVLSGLDFSAVTNLNGVASILTTAIGSAGNVKWNGSYFLLSSASIGAGVSAAGSITLSTNPAPNDTITINGVAITFVAASPVGSQVLIGSGPSQTATNLNTFLQASASANILAATYSVSGAVISVVSNAVGPGGNSFTLAKSSSAITLSGATLVGGTVPSSVAFATSPASGQDVSALLQLTQGTAQSAVPAFNAESPVAAVQLFSTLTNSWYGVTFAASVMPADSDYLACAAFIQAASISRVLGVTTQETGAYDPQSTSDLAYALMAGGYTRTICQYSSTQPFAICSALGRAFSVDFTGQNTVLDLMFKQEPGVVAESLSTTQANALQAKRCNVFVAYDNNTSILQYGTMSGPQYFDETYGIDWISNAMQTAVFNVNYLSSSKIPQTDQGNNAYLNAINGVCEQGVTNGLIAPGVWTQAGFGQLQTGQYLKFGYYTWIPPVASQSASDRAARKAPTIQVAIKFAGSNQIVNVIINANR